METSNKLTSGAIMLVMLFLLILSVITVMVCFSIKNGLSPGEQVTDTLNNVPANAEPHEKAVVYKVVSENGKLTVKDSGGNNLRVIHTYIELLPPIDREALAEGIPLYSDEELASFIEDVCG